MTKINKEKIEELKELKGEEIEKKSMEIIEKEIDLSLFSKEEKEIIKRVIHATADFEYKDTMIFHRDAIPQALKALKNGKDILVDIKMVEAGISQKYLGSSKVICYLSEVKEFETTRTEKAIELALKKEPNIGIIAIGNSPTALLKTIEVLKQKNEKKVVVIGMPVGFVKALESKIFLSKQDFPFITNISRKGGSPATCAVINALLRMKEW